MKDKRLKREGEDGWQEQTIMNKRRFKLRQKMLFLNRMNTKGDQEG